MKKVLAISLFLSLLGACNSNTNQVDLSVPAQDVNALSAPKSEIVSYLAKTREDGETHTVVFTSYESTSAGNMKLKIDFQCQEGRKDSITATSTNNKLELKIAHHGGEYKVVDLSKKENVDGLIQLCSELIIKADKDRKVVDTLVKSLKTLKK